MTQGFLVLEGLRSGELAQYPHAELGLGSGLLREWSPGWEPLGQASALGSGGAGTAWALRPRLQGLARQGPCWCRGGGRAALSQHSCLDADVE